MNHLFLALLLVPSIMSELPCVTDNSLCFQIDAKIPIVIEGILLKPTEADRKNLPLFGTSPYSRLYVKVHLDKVVRGSFKLAEGSNFLLAIHSIALTFGYDHYGELYLFGFETKDDYDYELAALVIPKKRLLFVQGRVRYIFQKEPIGEQIIELDSHPNCWVRLDIISRKGPSMIPARGSVVLAYYQDDSEILLQGVLCLVMIVRKDPDARPLRLLRVYRMR